MANATILAAITATCAECKKVLVEIKRKEAVETAHYIVCVARKPAVAGLHLAPEAPAAGGGGAPAARGGGGGGGGYLPPHQQLREMGRVVAQNEGSILELQIPTFEVVRRPVVKTAVDVLAEFTVNLQITPVNDLFNDKLDFSVRDNPPPPSPSSLPLSTAKPPHPPPRPP